VRRAGCQWQLHALTHRGYMPLHAGSSSSFSSSSGSSGALLGRLKIDKNSSDGAAQHFGAVQMQSLQGPNGHASGQAVIRSSQQANAAGSSGYSAAPSPLSPTSMV
jgi:hypothetical protein